MTITTTTNRTNTNGDDATVAFNFPYYVEDAGDLEVWLRSSAGVETLQTITTHYSLAGLESASVTITMVTPPATGERLTIIRKEPHTNETAADTVNAFKGQAFEEQFDRFARGQQALADELERSIRLKDTDLADSTGEYDAQSRRIVNVADGVDSNDAANVRQITDLTSSAVADAAASATAAAASEVLTAADAVSTNIDKIAAADSATAAADSATLAAIYEGDFKADGSIPMTGNFDGGGQDIINVGNVDGRDVSTDGTKLDAIEAAADVTDTVNVDAAGATMNADTDVSANAWVLDEDAMGSDDPTKVPTQQSVKAYVDASNTSQVVHKGAYDASINSPDLDTSPSVSILTGWMYTVTAAGTFFTIDVEVGDVLISNADSPTLETDWTITNKNLDAASDSVPGIVELATIAETDTGTDTTRSLTPAPKRNVDCHSVSTLKCVFTT